MVAADIIKTLKGGLAFARLTQGDASLDTLDAAMDGARSAGALALRVGARMPDGPEARLATELVAAVTAGGDGGDRLLLLLQMVELSLPAPRDLAALGLNAVAIATAMCARLREPEGARAEDYAFLHPRFAALITPALQGLIDDRGFIESLTAALWQQALGDLSAIRSAQDEQTAMLRELLARSAPGLPLETARAILVEFGEYHDGNDPAGAERVLRAKAAEYQTLRARLLELDNSGDLMVRDLMHEARTLIEQGRFDAADERLIEAERHADLARARIRANRGDLAMLRLRYREAAEHFAEAAQILPEAEMEACFGYHLRAFDALFQQGQTFYDADALSRAAGYADDVLLHLAQHPTQHSAALRNKGIALSQLGRILASSERLLEAEFALRSALEASPPDAHPIDWAHGVSLLGTLYGEVAELGGNDDVLCAAIDQFERSLEILTHDAANELWAASLLGLANCFVLRGDRRRSSCDLVRAERLIEDALHNVSEADSPQQWYGMMSALAHACRALGELEKSAASLEKSMGVLRDIRAASSRRGALGMQAETLHNLAVAELSLFNLTKREAHCAAAVEHAQAAAAYFEAAGATGPLARTQDLLAKIEAARPD